MDKTLTGKVMGNVEIRMCGPNKMYTTFLMESEDGAKERYNIQGIHDDKLLPNTNVRVNRDVAKGWIKSYEVLDSKGHIEYSFSDD